MINPIVVAMMALSSLLMTVPHGSYCGSVPGLVNNIQISILNATMANGSAVVFGQNISCPAEPYSYDPVTNVFILTNINNPSDCLGYNLGKYGLSPPQITYSNKSNFIKLDFGIADVKLIAC